MVLYLRPLGAPHPRQHSLLILEKLGNFLFRIYNNKIIYVAVGRGKVVFLQKSITIFFGAQRATVNEGYTCAPQVAAVGRNNPLKL